MKVRKFVHSHFTKFQFISTFVSFSFNSGNVYKDLLVYSNTTIESNDNIQCNPDIYIYIYIYIYISTHLSHISVEPLARRGSIEWCSRLDRVVVLVV